MKFFITYLKNCLLAFIIYNFISWIYPNSSSVNHTLLHIMSLHAKINNLTAFCKFWQCTQSYSLRKEQERNLKSELLFQNNKSTRHTFWGHVSLNTPLTPPHTSLIYDQTSLMSTRQGCHKGAFTLRLLTTYHRW